jgi:uncharacterized protein with HEPN domain
MLDAAYAVSNHIKNKKPSDLEEDRLLLGGIIRELLLIGEAANAVSQESKAKITEIPWKKVVGMRNQLIHGYFDISYRIVWSTIVEDIPSLISCLEDTLAKNS